MKKIIASIIVMSIAIGVMSCSGGSKDQLIVGTEPGFAPYEYIENNNVVGIDMDIAKAIADSMGKELVIKQMDFDGALLAVQQGKVDFVAAGVSVDEKRKKAMDFSDFYVESTEVVVVNKNANTVEATYDKDADEYTIGLENKIVGVQLGNIADFWVEENANAKELKQYPKFAQAAEDLKNNKIDCIVMDLYPAIELVEANEELEILKVDNKEAILFADNYAIPVQKGNTELLEKINKVIKELKDSGKIDEFTANHTKK